MAFTNFAALTEQQKTVWARETWSQARLNAAFTQFTGDNQFSMVQRIKTLTKDERGTRAIITLVPDDLYGFVVGDRQLEGNETALNSYTQEIQLDLLRKAHSSEGRLAEQETIVNFRETARDTLSYALSNALDQLFFLTLSGVDYSVLNSGGNRPLGDELKYLRFNADVVPPSPKHVFRWQRNTSGDLSSGTLVEGGASNAVVATDTPTWDLLVKLKTQAHLKHIKPLARAGGSRTYNVFLSPLAMEKLKLDPKYWEAVKGARARSASNPLFTGEEVEVDGLRLFVFDNVVNTYNAPTGSKYGAAGDIDGCQILLCGAQSLAYVEIGSTGWEEKKFDYSNRLGVSLSRMIGFLKPQFRNQYTGNTLEDHGVLSVYVAQ
jgi:hypothetical protein